MAGRKGPQVKNPAVRQRRNSVGPRGLVVVAVEDRPGVSGRWLKVTKDAWVEFWDSELAGAVAGKDMSALRRLFDQRDMFERMRRIVDKDPLIAGSQGQPVLNPAARLMSSLMTEIRQMEREFGLTPDAGSRMVSAAVSATRSVEELVRGGDDDLQVIDVSVDAAG